MLVKVLGDRVTGGSPAVDSQAELNRICVITPRRACVRVLPALPLRPHDVLCPHCAGWSGLLRGGQHCGG